jgi:Ran-binding protein 9/10
VLEGDIDKALKYTDAYYPRVLMGDQRIYFRLRCQRFIEGIRQASEILNPPSMNVNSLKHHMELSYPLNRADKEEQSEKQREYNRLIQTTLNYGQDLQEEFKNDPRRNISKSLEDIFALVAYEDPLNDSNCAYTLDLSHRKAVADEISSAIKSSLGL